MDQQMDQPQTGHRANGPGGPADSRGDIAEAASMAPDHRFVGFEMPFGWYSVGYANEFDTTTPQARTLCEIELVVWRQADGTPVVQEAFCPHLGAHLAVGGTIEHAIDKAVADTELSCVRCPFHGWAFDATGTNAEIPYADRTNAQARLHTYPSTEVNGIVFFWWHPDREVAPMWELPSVHHLADGNYDTLQSWTVEAPWQEFSENGSDTAHFAAVHGSPKVANMEEADYSFPVRRMFVRNEYPTKRGPLEGTQETVTYGPGLGVTHFSIAGADIYLVATQAPLSPTRTVARFAWFYGDNPLSQKIGPKFAAEVERQFNQDLPIWNHKRHVRQPSLAPTDGPIMGYRKWAAKFYAGSPTANRTETPND